ncbi:MAG: hypothetical protein AAGG01_20420 [Planctomycetota bacterium]
MRVNPDQGTGVDDYVVVGEGTYPMRVDSVRVSNNADGDVSWMLRLALVDGDRAGRIAVIDWLNFSDRGMHRVRGVLSALGFDTSVEVEVQPEDLDGLVANITIFTQETENRESGRITRRSRVKYGGWGPCPDAERYQEEVEPRAMGQTSGGAGTGLAADSMPF